MKKLTLSLALILSALSSASFAAVPTVPNTFVAGDVASASKVNENFASIADAISTEVTARITDSVAFQASIDAQSLKLTNLEKQGQTADIDCVADTAALKTAYNDGYSGVNILAGSCEADFLINGRNFDITSDGLSSQTLLTQGTYEFDLALIASTVNITNVDVIGRIVVVRNSLMLFTDSDLDCSAYKGLRPGFVAQNSEIQLINANVSGCTSVALKYDSTLRLRGKTSVSGGTYGNAITAENNSNIIANDDASDILVYMDNSDLVAPDTFKESIWLSGSSLQLSDSGLTLAGSIYGADSHLEISNITWLAAGDNVQKFIRAHLNSHLDLRNLDPTNSEINVSLSSTLIMSGMEDFQISDLDMSLTAGSAGVILTPLFTEAASPASNGLWLGEGSNLNMFVNDTLYPSYEFDFDFAASSGSEFRLSGGTIANPDPCGGGGLYYVNGAALCGSLATTADLDQKAIEILSGDTGNTTVDCTNGDELKVALDSGIKNINIVNGACTFVTDYIMDAMGVVKIIGTPPAKIIGEMTVGEGTTLSLTSLAVEGGLSVRPNATLNVDAVDIDCGSIANAASPKVNLHGNDVWSGVIVEGRFNMKGSSILGCPSIWVNGSLGSAWLAESATQNSIAATDKGEAISVRYGSAQVDHALITNLAVSTDSMTIRARGGLLNLYGGPGANMVTVQGLIDGRQNAKIVMDKVIWQLHPDLDPASGFTTLRLYDRSFATLQNMVLNSAELSVNGSTFRGRYLGGDFLNLNAVSSEIVINQAEMATSSIVSIDAGSHLTVSDMPISNIVFELSRFSTGDFYGHPTTSYDVTCSDSIAAPCVP